MKIYVKAIMDEDVFDELCSHPKKRVIILEAAKSPEYGDALMDLLGEKFIKKNN